MARRAPPRHPRLVDRICECEGCSDTTHEDYIDQYGDAQREAHNEGCDNQFGEYIACADQELECRESLARFDGCDSEQRSYYNCIGVGTTNICPSSCSTNTAWLWRPESSAAVPSAWS